MYMGMYRTRRVCVPPPAFLARRTPELQDPEREHRGQDVVDPVPSEEQREAVRKLDAGVEITHVLGYTSRQIHQHTAIAMYLMSLSDSWGRRLKARMRESVDGSLCKDPRFSFFFLDHGCSVISLHTMTTFGTTADDSKAMRKRQTRKDVLPERKNCEAETRPQANICIGTNRSLRFYELVPSRSMPT